MAIKTVMITLWYPYYRIRIAIFNGTCFVANNRKPAKQWQRQTHTTRTPDRQFGACAIKDSGSSFLSCSVSEVNWLHPHV